MESRRTAPVRTAEPKRMLRPLLIASLLLAGSGAAAPDRLAGDLFEKYEVALDNAAHQAVLTGSFSDGKVADLAVVSIDDDGGRIVRFYVFGEEGWAPTLDVELAPAVGFVDVAKIDGRDRLITVGRDRLSWVDPDSRMERTLIEVPFFCKTSKREISHVDLTKDLNGDGRDDVVVPDHDGFWISTQTAGGSFTTAMKVGPSEPFLDKVLLEGGRVYAEVGLTSMTIPWYLSRIHQADWNLDGRTDLLFWNEDHFDVHLQNELGRFDPVAKTFVVSAPFDSDGLYSLMLGSGEESTFRLLTGLRKLSRRTVLHSIRDMNGDGIADLVVFSTEGRSLLRQRSAYTVHSGTRTSNGIAFASEASVTIRGRAETPVGYTLEWMEDFDGDGRVDVMIGVVNTGVGKMFRALLGNSITMNLDYYRLGSGASSETPNGSRRVVPKPTPLSGRGPFFPTILVGDVNGDARADLLVGKNWDELDVHMGVSGSDVFAHEPRTVQVALTANEKNARVVDLNRDGRDDLLIHHPSADSPARMIILLANPTRSASDLNGSCRP